MILLDMPIQNNKPVGETSFRKDGPYTQESDKKFDIYLRKLLNKNSSESSSKRVIGQQRETKEEKEKLTADKISVIEGDLLLFFCLLGITDENKEIPVEGALDDLCTTTEYSIGEMMELVSSAEDGLDSRTEEVLDSLLAKLKNVNVVLEDYQGDRKFSFSGSENMEYEKEFYSKINRLMTELAGKNLTGTEIEKVLESTEGFRDLSARLTRLEIYLQNLVDEKDSTRSIDLKSSNDYFKLSKNNLDTDLTLSDKEDAPFDKSKIPVIENSNGKLNNVLSGRIRGTDKLSVFNETEVEETNANKELELFSEHNEFHSKDSNSPLAEHSNNSKFEDKAESETNDIKGQEFTGIEQKGIQQRAQFSSRPKEVSQLNQRDIYEQIDKHIQSVVHNGQNRIEIQLEPETLGKVHLKLELENGKVSVYFNVDNNLVKDQLEQNLVLLKQNFLKLGYNVDHIQVETEEQKTAFQQGQHQQSNPEQQGYNLNGQQQKSQYDGLSPGELYELFLEEEKGLDTGLDSTNWRWYQYKYGYLSINMNYLA